MHNYRGVFCSPEIQACDPAFWPAPSSQGLQLHSPMVTAAKAASSPHVSNQFFLVHRIRSSKEPVLVHSLITCLYSIISLLNTVLHRWISPCEHCFEFAALTVKAVLSRHECQEATCCFTLFPDYTSITLKNETSGTNNHNRTDRIFYHHCLKCDVQ